jgi:hypothetical protein
MCKSGRGGVGQWWSIQTCCKYTHAHTHTGPSNGKYARQQGNEKMSWTTFANPPTNQPTNQSVSHTPSPTYPCARGPSPAAAADVVERRALPSRRGEPSLLREAECCSVPPRPSTRCERRARHNSFIHGMEGPGKKEPLHFIGLGVHNSS